MRIRLTTTLVIAAASSYASCNVASAQYNEHDRLAAIHSFGRFWGIGYGPGNFSRSEPRHVGQNSSGFMASATPHTWNAGSAGYASTAYGPTTYAPSNYGPTNYGSISPGADMASPMPHGESLPNWNMSPSRAPDNFGSTASPMPGNSILVPQNQPLPVQPPRAPSMQPMLPAPKASPAPTPEPPPPPPSWLKPYLQQEEAKSFELGGDALLEPSLLEETSPSDRGGKAPDAPSPKAAPTKPTTPAVPAPAAGGDDDSLIQLSPQPRLRTLYTTRKQQ